MKMHDLGLPTGVVWHEYDNANDAASAVAEAIAQRLTLVQDDGVGATLVLSGGSTPKPMFESLRKKPVAWGNVTVLLADERWVPESDEASNARMVRQHFLRGTAGAARFVSLKANGDTPEEGLTAVSAELETVTLPADVLVLGMGNDGHTASLFPDAPELPFVLNFRDEDSPRVAAMHPLSQAQARITLTPAALCGSPLTILHLKGEDKLATLKIVCEDIEDVASMPIRMFMKKGLHVFWSP